jgi:hypothetical protein
MEDEDKIELLEDDLKAERCNKKTIEGRYQWVIIILLSITCGIGGYAISATQLTREVTANTTDIKNLKEQFARIDSKLDLLLLQKKETK